MLYHAGHTLPPDTPVAQNTDPPTGLVVESMHVLVESAPDVFFLGLVGAHVVARGNEPVHDGPLGDWGAVDAGACCYGDVGVLHARVVDEVVQPGGDGVDELYAVV